MFHNADYIHMLPYAFVKVMFDTYAETSLPLMIWAGIFPWDGLCSSGDGSSWSARSLTCK